MTKAAACYLDHNATTPLLPAVQAAVRETLDAFGNPSSVHGAGRHARALVEEARERLARQTGALPAEIVFTSGGTEANVLALRGLAESYGAKAVMTSGLEHASVLAALPQAMTIACSAEGVIDLNELERALRSAPNPAVVALMLANNETGILQPVAEAVALARAHGAIIHCDAVQGLGRVPLDFAHLGVDSMSLSAHKVGGLKGIGALIVRRGRNISSQILGGGQERRRRAGTENVTGIVSFGAAAREVPRLLADVPRIKNLRDDLEARVGKIAPHSRIYGQGATRIANTTCVSLAGVSSETQVMRLDLAGVAVSAGSACSSGKITPSHVLIAMGVESVQAKSAIRVSLGWPSTEADVARFIEAWQPLALNAAA